MTLFNPGLRIQLIRVAAFCAVVVALAGCTALQVQNPSGNLRPVNAAPAVDGQNAMLKGHDVVAYHTQGKHLLGNASFTSVHEGTLFRFANAEHKTLFDKDPQKYLPAYGGFCANGIVYGIPWGGDGDAWTLINGRVYIFGGQGSKEAFLLDPAKNVALADQYWRDEISGSNSFLQRFKRLTLRVPHYKSGAELAADVAAKKAKGG